MTMPAIAVVGYSDSGKTTVATALVRILHGDGYKVAAVKHCPHGHDVDREGSDTHRMGKAGADAVIAVSPERVSKMERVDGEPSLESIAGTLTGYDLVIAEGFKDSAAPKVLVARLGRPVLDVPNAVAIVTDMDDGEFAVGPCFGFGEIRGLAAYLRERFLIGMAADDVLVRG